MTHDVSIEPRAPGQGVVTLPKLGRVWLAWLPGGLVRLEQREHEDSAERRAACLREGMIERDVPAIFREPLERFDAGEPIDLATIPVVLRGSPFFVAVWTALRKIPRGHVRTYGGLAKDAGSPRATRAVGTAMAKNPLPLVVPCHRVIANGGRLGGYSDGPRSGSRDGPLPFVPDAGTVRDPLRERGLPRKRLLLAMEGVRIEGDRVLPGQLDLF
jgi:methylated-DNA-[protein]-cysteine S-methyltransferase